MSSTTLRHKAYHAIREGILEARFRPGALLSEHQLAAELDISRTPIREALRELATGGLVRILPQRGVVVSELSGHDIAEVYQLREQLEGFAASLAAGRIDDLSRAGFQADHRDAVAHLEAGHLRPAYDAAVLMHERIIRLARNSRLQQVMTLLGDQVHRFGLLTLRSGHARQAIDEHGEIIAAMLDGDGASAERLMRAHLRADRDLALRAATPSATTAGTGTEQGRETA